MSNNTIHQVNPKLSSEENLKNLLVANTVIEEGQKATTDIVPNSLKEKAGDGDRNTTIVVKKPSTTGGKEYVEVSYVRVPPAPLLSTGEEAGITIDSIFTEEDFRRALTSSGVIIHDVHYQATDLNQLIDSKTININSNANSLVYTGNSNMRVQVNPVIIDLDGFMAPSNTASSGP